MGKLHKNKEYYSKTEWTVGKVREEVDSGLALLNKIDNRVVTFFGSHNTSSQCFSSFVYISEHPDCPEHHANQNPRHLPSITPV